jgi:hypothetical protein
MKYIEMKSVRGIAYAFGLGLLVTAGITFAQEQPPVSDTQPPATRGWRRVTDPPPAPGPAQTPPATDQASLSGHRPLDAYGQPSEQEPAGPSREPQPAPQYTPVPDQLTIKSGTYLTVRVDQLLSSDHNQPGDAFVATLVKPLVIDGVVVAQRGQTVAGRVVEASKAGRVQGASRLAVQVTEVSLVDGQQLPVQTQLISRTGTTSFGRDAGGIAGTTLGGAAIGAAVNGGVGAGVGAAAGLVVGTVGVLLTRGHATYITPEAVLTFRVEAPVAVVTARAPQAFRYVEPSDYGQSELASRPAPRMARPMPPPYYYGPGYYRPYWGSSLGMGFNFGPRFYGGRGYRGRWR